MRLEQAMVRGKATLRALLLGFAGVLALQAQGRVPRPAPELRINAATKLSNFRGHVVLLAFISTECSHCQRASVVFEKLSREFNGLQVLEVAFNDHADAPGFGRKLGLSFLIGTGSADAARDFLGVPRGERLGTPQVVVIDKSGIIRAQSERLGSPILQTPDFLREVLAAVSAR